MPGVIIDKSIIFITGTNRQKGIGRALVKEAIKLGAKKVYATARDIVQLEDLATQYPSIVIPVNLDITDRHSIEETVGLAGDTQILINNAGFANYSGICFNYCETLAAQEFDVNYFGMLNLTRAFSKTLINNSNTAIANVISIGALLALPLCATYSASKAAAHSLTQTIRAELAEHQVSVFGIYPGPVDTDMAEGMDMIKEKPENVAIRILNEMEKGTQYIYPDDFAANFVKEFRDHPKVTENGNLNLIHKMPKDFLDIET